ncbi:hypothetical protein FJZ33_05325 [Candidatus Poribacteria bacterium]|nr:hypothetical protein [Candidatus Poribacteria bacterium]
MKKFGIFCIFILVAMNLTTFFCWGAAKVDIAISTHAGWYSQAAADREMNLVADAVKGKVGSVTIFPIAQEKDLADWLTKHTRNKQLDILILNGQFPNAIYPAGNGKPNDSIAELFLEDGNMIINTGDYMFYVVNGAGTNAAGGLQNMMDIPGITMWDDNTPVTVTADGKKYLPTLKDFQTDRPFHLNELVAPWEVEVTFAQNAAGTRADPCVVRDTKTDGRLAIFYQTAGQDTDPRGKVISEFILNWLPTVVKIAVEPAEKLGTLWGKVKAAE